MSRYRCDMPVIELSKALSQRGWKLYDTGILEKDGAVVCIGVSRGYQLDNSGGRKYTEYVDAGPCPRCGGSDAEPGGITLEEARAAGRVGYVYPQIIPEMFLPDGRLECQERYCVKGRYKPPVQRVEPWPTFQANPRGCVWHVERDGKILDRGTGVYAIYEGTQRAGPRPLVLEDWEERREAKVKLLLDRIDRAAANGGRP